MTPRSLLALAAVVVALRAWVPEVATPRPPLPAGWTVLFLGENLNAVALAGDLVLAGGATGLRAAHRARGVPVELDAPAFSLVQDIRVDERGRLWVAHGGGVSCRGDGAWRHFAVGAGRALAAHQGAMLAGVESGLVKLGVDRPEPVPLPPAWHGRPVDVIVPDRTGSLWIGSHDPGAPGLARLAGQWQVLGATEGLPHPCVNAGFEASDGTLWFATGYLQRGGLARRAPGAQRFTRLGQVDGLAADQVRSVHQDRGGWLFVGSESDGLAVFDGHRWRVLTPADGLPGWEVKMTRDDAEGRLWMATAAGLLRIDGHAALGARR